MGPRHQHLGRLSADEADRRRRLHRFIGLCVVVALAVATLWGRCVVSVERQHLALHVAAVSLDQALGNPSEAAWDEAESRYAKATRGGIFERYPLWTLEMVHRWRTDGPSSGPDDVRVALEAIRRRAYAQALKSARLVEDEDARELVTRLATDLTAAAAERSQRSQNTN